MAEDVVASIAAASLQAQGIPDDADDHLIQGARHQARVFLAMFDAAFEAYFGVTPEEAASHSAEWRAAANDNSAADPKDAA